MEGIERTLLAIIVEYVLHIVVDINVSAQQVLYMISK